MNPGPTIIHMVQFTSFAKSGPAANKISIKDEKMKLPNVASNPQKAVHTMNLLQWARVLGRRPKVRVDRRKRISALLHKSMTFGVGVITFQVRSSMSSPVWSTMKGKLIFFVFVIRRVVLELLLFWQRMLVASDGEFKVCPGSTRICWVVW